MLCGDGSHLTAQQMSDSTGLFKGVDLLVLSGSNTAIDFNSQGREIEGFSVMAERNGAKSVLASLWNVEDRSTADLMEKFYKYLWAGRSEVEALRSAQLEMLASKDYSLPYYWAAFTLSGNWQ